MSNLEPKEIFKKDWLSRVTTQPDHLRELIEEVRELALVASAIVALLAFGTLGYMIVEGWSFLDSLYMTAITVTTVGFQEVQPLSSSGRIFTTFLIFLGVGVATGVLSTLARRIIETQIQWVFRRKKMNDKLSKMEGHTIFCGYGRLTQIAVSEYIQTFKGKPQIVIIDQDPERLAEVEAAGFSAIRGDATLEEVLVQAGIERAGYLVCLLPKDSDNLYCVLTAKEMNPDIYVMCRAEDDAGEKRLRRAGASRVVAPYRIGGHRVATGLLRPHVAAFLDLAVPTTHGDLQLEEIIVPDKSPLAGLTLAESTIRQETSIIVAAIIDAAGKMAFNPSARTVLESGSTLICFGYREDFERLEKIVVGDEQNT